MYHEYDLYKMARSKSFEKQCQPTADVMQCNEMELDVPDLSIRRQAPYKALLQESIMVAST